MSSSLVALLLNLEKRYIHNLKIEFRENTLKYSQKYCWKINYVCKRDCLEEMLTRGLGTAVFVTSRMTLNPLRPLSRSLLACFPEDVTVSTHLHLVSRLRMRAALLR
jgi:hypothetical protein